MCGFIFNQFKKKSNRKKFYNAAKLIFNRGPDNKTFRFYKDREIFHSRLKIIDLDKRSNQPFTVNDYSIIFNGEIYNYQILKNQLQKFYDLKTKSDTEILLLSYLKWGKNMFNKIEGMYSFIIYNKKNKNIFFARDHYGQKPLYYTLNNNQIILASEIKPIIKILNIKNSINDNEVYKYLNFNFHSDSHETFFKNIYQLKSGHYGTYINNKLTIKKISLDHQLKNNDLNNLDEKFLDEIKKHLIGDVEVGLLISEGIDSRSILDISNKLIKKKLNLFNLDFDLFNNQKFENSYKSNNQRKLHKVKLYKDELFKLLNITSKICETPPLSLFTLGMFKLFENIKQKKIKVVLNGQGVDEIFGGYKNFFVNEDRNIIYHPSGFKLNFNNHVYKKKKIRKKKLSLIEKKKDYLYKSKIPKNLNQIDKISMFHSIECRSPYLSDNFIPLIKILDSNQMKYKNHYKYLFRKILFKYTKNNFYFREKEYKQMPQKEFLLEEKNYKKISKLIYQDNYCDRFFNKKLLKKYLISLKEDQNSGFVIWQYLSLNAFCNQFHFK